MFFNLLDSLFKFPDRCVSALKFPGRVIFHLKFPGTGAPTAPCILQPWCQAATDDDVKRILDFIIALDHELGYPCTHRKVPLYVVGDYQVATWSSLHSENKKVCEKSNHGVMGENRLRKYVQFDIPSISLGKTKTDLCNEHYNLSIYG